MVTGISAQTMNPGIVPLPFKQGMLNSDSRQAKFSGFDYDFVLVNISKVLLHATIALRHAYG
jgi:hypothetical protein